VGGALVLSGEAGIGKSSLLREAAVAASDLQVLTAAGTEAEVALPFAGLHALLSPLLPRLNDIPAPHTAALSAAFALSAPEAAHTFTVAAGSFSLLVAAAAGTPVLALVDDLHRLDRASRDALLFVGRRLSCQGIGLVCATRTDGPAATRTGLPHCRVGPLDHAASRKLLGRARDVPIAPAVADQLVNAAEGLPLALVELPTLLDPAELSGEAPLRNPLPAGPRLCEAYAPLLDALAPASRGALVVAAAAGDLDLARVLAAVAQLNVDQAALEVAEAAGVVRLGTAGVSFRTPLVRAVVYQSATAAERRAAHAALAEVTDAGRRARHLGLATLGPDEDVAAEIEALVVMESRHSDPALAAQLMERAAGLSLGDDQRARRQALAAELWQHAAAPGRVIGLLNRAIRLSGDLRVRGHVQAVRGRQELLVGRPLPAHRLLVHEAARVRVADPGRAATMLADSAQACCLAGQSQAGLVMARHAWLLTRQAPGLLTAVVAAQLAAVLSFRGDLMAARELVDEWTSPLDDAAGDDGVPLEYRRIVQLVYPGVLLRLGELDQAWRVLDAGLYQCRGQGVAAQLPGLLAARAQLDLRLGEWESAREAAAEALPLARAAGQQGDEVAVLVAAGQLAAGRGQASECRLLLAAARRICRLSGLNGYLVAIDAAEGLLELGKGEAPAALARLEQIARRVETGAAPDPGAIDWAADLVEAAAGSGRQERARQALAQLERLAAGSATLPAVVARCRALLDGCPAVPEQGEQVDEISTAPDPFNAARTDLWLGVRFRDAGRSVDARARLLEAAATFERLGAQPWADRARQELIAVGPEAEHLTPQEHRVVVLVAQGSTNREVASALFLSQKTIEFHLRNVFRKLGLRSRTELANLVGRNRALPLGEPI
jgi:DNA-binding CsgD family transcriptional regulator